MTETLNSLQHKMASAGDLQTVVRAMKAMAAANISQYEQAVTALANYDNTLTQALGACLRERARLPQNPLITATVKPAALHVIVFGSDQGLVGQFNDAIVSYTLAQLALPTLAHLQQTAKWWVVGERAQMRFAELNTPVNHLFPVPTSVKTIAPLISQLQFNLGIHQGDRVIVFNHQPLAGNNYAPSHRQLLPLDATWQQNITQKPWPTKNTPQIINFNPFEATQKTAEKSFLNTVQKLIHEALFISLYQACAQSLSAENASRLAAMERADNNINELQTTLKKDFHHLRQSAIDTELFDVITGYEALAGKDALQ